MSSQHQKIILVDHHFDDFDDLTQTTRFWDLDFQQIDHGRFQGHIFQAGLGRMQIVEARFQRCLQQKGSTPSGMRTFVVPASDTVAFHWRKHDVGPHDLLIFPRSRELYSISDTGFHVFTLSVPEADLEAAAEQAGVRGLSYCLQNEKVTAPELLSGLRTTLRRTIDRWASLDDIDAAALQRRIVGLIVEVLTAGTASAGSSGTCRQDQALSDALSLIDRSGWQLLTVADLCEAVDVSERTLRNAFQRHFGISPKAYLTARRLNGVRRELRQLASAGANINEVSAAWGFWHMGQFAADYKRHFGELPSESVRRFRI